MEFPKDADGDGLRLLHESGNDFSKPMDIEFHLAAPDEETAITLANAVGAHGYRTSIYFDDEIESDDQESADAWTVECSKVMIVTYDSLVAAQANLNQIAKPMECYVDGWGTFGNAD